MLRKLSTSYTDIIHRFRWAIVVELCITHHSPLDANAEEEVGDEKAIQSSVAVIITKGEKDSSPHRSPTIHSAPLSTKVCKYGCNTGVLHLQPTNKKRGYLSVYYTI